MNQEKSLSVSILSHVHNINFLPEKKKKIVRICQVKKSEAMPPIVICSLTEITTSLPSRKHNCSHKIIRLRVSLKFRVYVSLKHTHVHVL